MDRHEPVAARRQSHCLEDPGRALGRLAVAHHRVVHHVAGQDRSRREPFTFQVVHRGRRGSQQQVRDVVRDDAVHFLGHPAVEAPDARLDVPHRDVELGGRQGTGHARVRVAVDHHHVGADVEQHGLELLQHLSRLTSVRPRADGQIEGGRWNVQLLEEHVGHVGVVVLAGVNDEVLDRLGGQAVVALERAGENRHFDELGTRPHDADDPHDDR